MDIKKLTEEEIKLNLSKVNDWKIENGKLHKLFKFKNFNEAISFIVGVSMICEKMNHHPEWSNVYGNVDVKLVTHKVAGITELDFQLAEKMDDIARRNVVTTKQSRSTLR
ncbi:MAG: 4a-hydroxytetrahydrobiopterin dehydratase [Candidatus Melainabacteria bacterium RIFCSPHIGHO2_02_FULL_34_12]|nr:MAG: 4a-hydroxytetrahydrobiopterin dehydratase [Candidatus Melainabacteria bacterium RIFCSPHIGHO2_02_FULL_34_12]